MTERKPRFDPVKPGTRAFFQEAKRIADFSLFDRLHAYVYARWTYLYIGMGLREHPVARTLDRPVNWLGQLLPKREDPEKGSFADGYHGKVVPLDAATQLVTVQEDVDLGDLEQIIPYPVARDIVLKNPDHIVALECPCRSVRPNPCLPLDVCLVIGEPFASFVAEHHPSRSRWISQGEAVDILQAEHDRGHVSHAFLKDAMLDRFYAICNCCSCCCGAMQSFQGGTPMLASSGYVAQVDDDLCAACGLCTDYCQFEALALNDDHAIVDAAACMGCGACVSKCPQEAISLLRAPDRGEPLEIQKLIAQAAETAQN